jgi:hypothetical protein
VDGITLVHQARAAGMTLRAEGNKLVIRGPESAEPIVDALREHKVEVLALLASEEVAGRVEALRGQVPAHGPIVVPPVRPGLQWAGVASRTCSLCGDPLPADRQFRCEPCVRAVAAVLNEVRDGAEVASDGESCDRSDQSDNRVEPPANGTMGSPDAWQSPLAVRLGELTATGLDEEQALGQALAEQAARHAQTCGVDPWMPDEPDEPDEDGVSVLRCWRCGWTAPPEVQHTHLAAEAEEAGAR